MKILRTTVATALLASIAFAGGPLACSSCGAARPSQNWLERKAAFQTVGALRPPT